MAIPTAYGFPHPIRYIGIKRYDTWELEQSGTIVSTAPPAPPPPEPPEPPDPLVDMPRIWTARLTTGDASPGSSSDLTAQVIVSPGGYAYHAVTKDQSGAGNRVLLLTKRFIVTGNIDWQILLGQETGSTEVSDSQVCMAFHPSGDLIIATSSNDNTINPCYSVSRVTPGGVLVWNVRPRLPDFQSISVRHMAVASDGSIYVCGDMPRATQYAWVARHNDTDGTYSAVKHLGILGGTSFWVQPVDGGVLVGGRDGTGPSGAFLAKLTSDLSSVDFYRRYRLASGDLGVGEGWALAPDGSVVVALSDNFASMVRLSADGSSVVDSVAFATSQIKSILFDTDGNCYAITTSLTNEVARVIKLDTSLNIVERRNVVLFTGSLEASRIARAQGVDLETGAYISTHTQAAADNTRNYWIYGVKLQGDTVSIDNNIGSTSSTGLISTPTPETPVSLVITNPTPTLTSETMSGYATPLTRNSASSNTWEYRRSAVT
jgi:hypothetical protein